MQPIEAILPHLWIAGRSPRAEWWRIHITCAVLATMLEHMMIAQLVPRDGGSMQPISLLWPLASLALAWISFASTVRRFHDRGKSGWWALLYFVPGIGWLWLLIECGFLPGKPAVRVEPAVMPAAAPSHAPPTRPSRRAVLQTVQRVGTVQRAPRQPISWGWIARRAVVLGAVILLALYLHVWAPMSRQATLPAFESQPLQSQPSE